MNLEIVLIIVICVLIVAAVASAVLAYSKGVNAGIERRKQQAEALVGSAEQQAERIIDDAKERR